MQQLFKVKRQRELGEERERLRDSETAILAKKKCAKGLKTGSSQEGNRGRSGPLEHI